METKIFTEETIAQAASVLTKGGVVAFPTETVYGLGAIATSQEAVVRVFQAKGRPSDNPLIVHVSHVETVKESVVDFPEMAQQLADAFWPGPLTMILHAKEGRYAPAISAGLSTVSFRMPRHDLTLRLIDAVGIPLVGPSANRSTRPSPTKLSHVLEDMDGRIDGVLDGGDTVVGVESTVIDLTNAAGPVILRPGVITPEQIEREIGPLAATVDTTTTAAPKAPGMKYRHYAPATPVVVVEGDATTWQKTVQDAKEQHYKVAVMATSDILSALSVEELHTYALGEAGSVSEMNHHLFDALRSLDHVGADVILAQGIPAVGAGAAYMNRLNKAASAK